MAPEVGHRVAVKFIQPSQSINSPHTYTADQHGKILRARVFVTGNEFNFQLDVLPNISKLVQETVLAYMAQLRGRGTGYLAHDVLVLHLPVDEDGYRQNAYQDQPGPGVGVEESFAEFYVEVQHVLYVQLGIEAWQGQQGGYAQGQGKPKQGVFKESAYQQVDLRGDEEYQLKRKEKQ